MYGQGSGSGRGYGKGYARNKQNYNKKRNYKRKEESEEEEDDEEEEAEEEQDEEDQEEQDEDEQIELEEEDDDDYSKEELQSKPQKKLIAGNGTSGQSSYNIQTVSNGFFLNNITTNDGTALAQRREPTLQESLGKTCPVCLQIYRSNTKTISPCKHKFCGYCIDNDIESCPVCRTKVDKVSEAIAEEKETAAVSADQSLGGIRTGVLTTPEPITPCPNKTATVPQQQPAKPPAIPRPPAQQVPNIRNQQQPWFDTGNVQKNNKYGTGEDDDPLLQQVLELSKIIH